jgi:hypothetical protein
MSAHKSEAEGDLHALLSISVIRLTLLLLREHRVRCGDVLELDDGQATRR